MVKITVPSRTSKEQTVTNKQINTDNSVLALQIAKIGEYMVKNAGQIAGDIGNVNHIHLTIDFISGRQPSMNITTSTDINIKDAIVKGGF